MALELKQSIRLSQSLVMTPQLQQAIKLLQLSRLELVNTIQQELVENPVLEESLDEETPVHEVGLDENESALALSAVVVSGAAARTRTPSSSSTSRCRASTGEPASSM